MAVLHCPTHVELAESSVDLLEALSSALFEAMIQRVKDARTQLALFPIFQTEAIDLPFQIFQKGKSDLFAFQTQARLGQVKLEKKTVSSARGRSHGLLEQEHRFGPSPGVRKRSCSRGDITLGRFGNDRGRCDFGWLGRPPLGRFSAVPFGLEDALALEPEPRFRIGCHCAVIKLCSSDVGEVSQQHPQDAPAAEGGVLTIGSLQRLDCVAVSVKPATPLWPSYRALGLVEDFLPSLLSNHTPQFLANLTCGPRLLALAGLAGARINLADPPGADEQITDRVVQIVLSQEFDDLEQALVGSITVGDRRWYRRRLAGARVAAAEGRFDTVAR